MKDTHRRFQVDENSARHVLTSTGLGEEGVEGVITTTDGLVGGHLTIWLDTVLEAEQLPAGVTALDAALADVDADALAHGCCGGFGEERREGGCKSRG